MRAEIVALEYAKNADYSNVRREDRLEVEKVVHGLVTFEKTMPALDIDIHDAGDHYNISAKGYMQQINIPRWFHKFHGDNSEYDFILDSHISPAPACIVLIKVKKRDFMESVRKSATRRRKGKHHHRKK